MCTPRIKNYVFENRVRDKVHTFPRTTVKQKTTTSQERTTWVTMSHVNKVEEIEEDDE